MTKEIEKLIEEIRSEAKMVGFDLSNKPDDEILRFALSFLCANIIDAFEE